ncbi:MAG TPA: hypothetical protein VFE54_04610 [Mucilaginibacter sp.]|jgi:hypothetical protein|nr:hypothetical protein [Mucilaginibacter sp.]
MKTRFLFPYWFRYLGLACFLIHIPIMLFFKKYHDMDSADTGLFTSSHVFFIFTTLMVTIGLFLFAFSKEKIEDEQIMQLRRDSLQWAVYVNYIVLIATLIFTEHMEIGHIMMLNMWTLLLFFIFRFQWAIIRNNWSAKKEG